MTRLLTLRLAREEDVVAARQRARQIAGALGVDVDRVSIKGKTNEGVGELGRGEAIAVHAIALLRSRN